MGVLVEGQERRVVLWLGRHSVSTAGLWTYIQAVLPPLLQSLTHMGIEVEVYGAGPKQIRIDAERLCRFTRGVRLYWRTQGASFSALRRVVGSIRDLSFQFESQSKSPILLVHGISNTIPVRGAPTSPTIVTLHDLLQPNPTMPPRSMRARYKQKYYQWYYDQMMDRVCGIVTGHEKTVPEIEEKFFHESRPERGKPPIRVVYPPLPAAYFEHSDENYAPKGHLLAFVSRDPRKNFSRTLAAFSSAHLDVQTTLVVVIGNEEMLESVRAEVQKSTVANQTYLVLRPGRRRLIELYRGARGTLFPSLGEGFGYPIYESLSQGTPVLTSKGLLASPFQKCRQMVEECDPHQVTSIAEGIKRLMGHETPSHLKAAVRQEIEGVLSPESAAKNLIDFYLELAKT
ncbi:MAG: glycosyltransferase [Bdellovibrionales bacterium]|nr:glycosyltransferase [Bdellovibrionales bacterium]